MISFSFCCLEESDIAVELEDPAFEDAQIREGDCSRDGLGLGLKLSRPGTNKRPDSRYLDNGNEYRLVLKSAVSNGEKLYDPGNFTQCHAK